MPSLLGDAGCKFINSFVLNIQWLEVCVCARARTLIVLMSNKIDCSIFFLPPSYWHIPQGLNRQHSLVYLLVLLFLFSFVLFRFAVFCLFRFRMTMLVESYLFVLAQQPPRGPWPPHSRGF